MEEVGLSKYSLVISASYRPALETLASECGFKWGDRGNVKELIEAIARKEIPLGHTNTSAWSPARQVAMVEAAMALRDAREARAARELVEMLNESEILPELRSLLDGRFGLFFSPVIEKIEEFIEKKQPFQLSYTDAANRHWTYTVSYAEIVFRDERNYLECWCEETEGNQDMARLRHNWSLRLDRIQDAGVVAVEGEWRTGLDTVEVSFELFGGLAHAYQQRDADIWLEWLSVEPPIRKVVRRISNTFWFIREVLPYGKDCLVLSPEEVREQIIEQLETAIHNYQGFSP